MIENTFCHIRGIGLKTEERLWAADILDWRCFAENGNLPLSRGKAENLRNEIARSEEAFSAGHADYFYGRLPAAQHWRMFRDFKGRAAYIDIETTGMASMMDYITAVTIYDGVSIRYYVYGDNLDNFIEDIFEYDLLITYNGKCFDVPFIESYFRKSLPHAHIDLRYVLSSLGYRGGLKKCEKEFGLSRGELDGVDGYFAVLLWHEYASRGNYGALETLLAYNIEDVINLEFLMHKAFNLKLDSTPFRSELAMDMPSRPQVPFCADPGIVADLRRKMPVGI